MRVNQGLFSSYPLYEKETGPLAKLQRDHTSRLNTPLLLHLTQ